MRNHITITIALTFAAVVSGESLWTSKTNNEVGMFADRKATRVGDILTIQVSEEIIANRSVSKSSSTNSSINHGFDGIVIPKIIDSDDTLPSISINPTESFSGGGSIADSNLLEAKIAVLVVDVQPNGNLIVEGARKVKSSGDAQYLVVRGIVRPDDVAGNNEVMSENVLNAGVEVFSEGDLKNAQTKGWIQRLVDVTNVF